MDNSFKTRYDCNIIKWIEYREELEKHAINSFIEKNLKELMICHDMGINPDVAINLVK